MPRRYSRAEWQNFLKGRRIAVLGTVGADGTPLLTPIWYLYRGGHILMRTDKESVKARNIARDPRVSLCVQDERPPYASVTVYGKASVEPAREGLGAEMAKHYLGAVGAAGYQRAVSAAIEVGREEVTLVITPERVLTQDFSAETPWFGRAWLVLKRVLPPWL
jgi:PPOX class probable F420-dependent enzyme